MKTKKKDTTTRQLLEAVADVIAHRAICSLANLNEPEPVPKKVPVWVSGPPATKTTGPPANQHNSTPEKILRR